MIKDLMEYAKYEEFMRAYENGLYDLYKNRPEEYKTFKAQLENYRYDVGSNERIYLAAMEATEFYAKINDKNHIENTPFLKRIAELESQYEDEDED